MPADDGPVPRCRLDDVPPLVRSTLEHALLAVRAQHPLAFEHVAINPPSPDAKTLPLYVVRDARIDEIDSQGCQLETPPPLAKGVLDRYSVHGICVADTSRIFCSAGAIRAILAEDPEPHAGVSPFLFYLFTHEIGHVALKHPGALSGHGLTIALSQPAAAKLSQLSTACLTDADQLAREQAADDIALDSMMKAFKEPAFMGPFSTPIESLIGNGERVYRGAQGLLDWSSRFYDNDIGLLGPVTQDVCELVDAKQGQLELPELGGDHPHEWRRLGKLMRTISETVTALDIPEDAPAELKADVSALRMNAMSDEVRNHAMESAVKAFCANVAEAQAGHLDCSAAAIERRRSIDIPEDEIPTQTAGGSVDVRHLTSKPRPEPASPVAQLVTLQVMDTVATVDLAKQRATKTAGQISDLLAALETQLDQQGGYVVYALVPPVTWRQDMLDSDYDVDATLQLVLRTPPGLDATKLPVGDLLRRKLHVDAAPWESMTDMAVMQFFPADPAKQQQSKRLLSQRVPFDFLFDVSSARAGTPNVLSPPFHHLLCYARARLDAYYHEHYSLHALDGNNAFYLPKTGINLPEAWIPLANAGCDDVSAHDAATVSRLSALFDYGKESQDVGSAEFTRIFESALR